LGGGGGGVKSRSNNKVPHRTYKKIYYYDYLIL